MNQFIEFLNRAADVWWPIVFHGTWQSALVGIVVLLVLMLGKRWPAPVRYGLVLLALAKFLVPPMASFPLGILSQFQLSASDASLDQGSPPDALLHTETISPIAVSQGEILPDPQETKRSANDVSMRELVEKSAAESGRHVEATVSPTPAIDSEEIAGTAVSNDDAIQASTNLAASTGAGESRPKVHFIAWLMLLHVCGAFVIGIAAWSRMRSIRKIVANGAPYDLAGSGPENPSFRRLASETLATVALKRTPQIVVSRDVRIPFSAGIFRPVVVLPQEAVDALTDDELRTVLLHELAHHKRGDLWMTWLQFYISLLWWFHPVVWLVNRTIRNTREDCCDDMLLSRALVPAADYCQAILKVAKGLRQPRLPSLLPMASMADRHPLAERITRIMDHRIRRTERLGIAGIAAVVIAGCLILPGLGRAPHSNVLADGTVLIEESAAPETGETLSVKGRLVDENGNPVDQAKVWLSVEERWESSNEGAPIIAEAQSTDDGRFEMKPLKSKVNQFVKANSTKFRFLVYKPGFALARLVHHGRVPESPVGIQMNPAPTTEFQIRNPDGSVCPGAIVSVQTAKFAENDYLVIPEVIRQLMATQTDADGHIRVPIEHDAIRSVEIAKKEIGWQSFLYFLEGPPIPTKLTLRKIGAIEGRLVLPMKGKADLSKVKLRVATLEKLDTDEQYWAGFSILQPDRDGRFRIPEIAEGTIRVFVTEPDNFAFRSIPPDGLIVTAGETTKLEIPMQKTVKVTRLIRDAKTKEPIAGVRVSLQDKYQHIYTRTNADGRFTAFILPEKHYHTAYNLPGDYMYRNIDELQSITAPSGVDAHEFEPIEFLRGRTVEGIVVNADGRPFADVQIGANWTDPSETFGIIGANSIDARSWGQSDAQGRFRLDGVNPDVDITLTAVRAGIRLSLPKTVGPEISEPVRLETRPFDFVSLNGRLVDEAQKPIARALIFIQVANDEASKEENWIRSMQQATDAEGRFKTPAHLPRQYHYRVSVRPRREEIPISKWLNPEKDGITYADLTVARDKIQAQQPSVENATVERGSLERTIVDSSRAPVADAQVIAWYNANRVSRQSGSDGRFVFPNVPPTGAWVFVKASGFRFHGEFTHPDANSQTIVLVRTEEPGTKTMQTLPAEPPSAEVEKLARDEFLKFVEVVLNSSGDSEVEHHKGGVHLLLASIDPNAALKLIGDKRFDFSKLNFSGGSELNFSGGGMTYGESYAIRVRVACAEEIAKSDLKKALQITQSLPGSEFQAHAVMEVALQRPEAERGKLLNHAAELAAQIPKATFRIEFLAKLGAMFRELGDHNRAGELFKQAVAEIPNLANDGRAEFTRRCLAWQMAPSDYEGALKLVSMPPEKRDGELNRIIANMAHQIAAINPAEAERLLGFVNSSPTNRESRIDAVVRVCYRMARADLPRAERIAREMSPNKLLSGYALGMIALATENQDRDHRLKLLEKAYDLLEADLSGSHTTIYHPLTIAVGLLPVVERVAPDRLEEFFWRALSMRTAISIGIESRALGTFGPGDTMRLADPVLGACLSRYDRETGRLLTMTPGDQTLEMGYSDAPFFLIGSLTILDPETAIRAVAKLPTENNRDLRGKHEAWGYIFALLGKSPTERWDYLMSRQYMLWRPDRVDF